MDMKKRKKGILAFKGKLPYSKTACEANEVPH
jgi:hypothetical protein